MSSAEKPTTWWGVEFRSNNQLDGIRQYLVWDTEARLFRTRRECRAFIEGQYGYIRERVDLRSEPHGWKMPVAVCVQVRRKP